MVKNATFSTFALFSLAKNLKNPKFRPATLPKTCYFVTLLIFRQLRAKKISCKVLIFRELQKWFCCKVLIMRQVTFLKNEMLPCYHEKRQKWVKALIFRLLTKNAPKLLGNIGALKKAYGRPFFDFYLGICKIIGFFSKFSVSFIFVFKKSSLFRMATLFV